MRHAFQLADEAEVEPLASLICGSSDVLFSLLKNFFVNIHPSNRLQGELTSSVILFQILSRCLFRQT